MGTWGAQNFDNDTAGDYYVLFIERMMTEIRFTMKMELQIHAGSYWGDVIPCMIEMITVLARQEFHCYEFNTDELRRWKRIFMDRWHMTIDECHPDDEYRKERERVLNRTFNKLIALSKQQ